MAETLRRYNESEVLILPVTEDDLIEMASTL
jgi:hypothetical protein